VDLGKGIESQAGLQITFQASDGSWVDRRELLTEGSDLLVSGLTILLVKDRPELQTDRIALLVGHVVEHILHLVLDTPLLWAIGKLGLQSVDHRLVAIGDP